MAQREHSVNVSYYYLPHGFLTYLRMDYVPVINGSITIYCYLVYVKHRARQFHLCYLILNTILRFRWFDLEVISRNYESQAFELVILGSQMFPLLHGAFPKTWETSCFPHRDY